MEDTDLIKHTNESFSRNDVLPTMSTAELAALATTYRRCGYVAIAGVVGRTDDSPQQLIGLIEKANVHIRNGGVFGPYVFKEDTEQQPGVMVYAQVRGND